MHVLLNRIGFFLASSRRCSEADNPFAQHAKRDVLTMTKRPEQQRSKQPRLLIRCILACFALLSAPKSSALTITSMPAAVSRLLFPPARGFNKRYGTVNNSIPDPDQVAARLNVQPIAKLPSFWWKYAWRGHGKLLRVLHWRDPAAARDADQSLKVVWLKALAAFNRKSPIYDPEHWTYDLLPTLSRWILLRFVPTFLYPRLHHANIELRTTYLDTSIQSEIDELPPNTKVRLISLGAGYDVRSARLLTSEKVTRAYELDIPSVTASKRIMLDRLQRRREKRGKTTLLPVSRSVDLNDLSSVATVLRDICSINHGGGDSAQEWHTIFVSEGVLIYLDKTIPGKLLKLCADTIKEQGGNASLCLADRLENSPGGEEEAGREELRRALWNVTDWCPKPGLARHMAVARLIKE